jgi:hypothetical protein
MAINVTAEPLVGTGTIAGSFVLGVIIVADPFVVTMEANQPAISHFPAAARNTALDQTLYLSYASNTDAAVTTSIHGTWLNYRYNAAALLLTASIHGTAVWGELWEADPFVVTLEPPASPWMTTEARKRNWVKWSNIGNLDFTIGRDNVAGERPIDWKGWIYAVKKLVGKVVVYGENGVSYLTPVGTSWGLGTASRIGLKGKGAVSGTDFVHFFVDREGRLFQVSIEKGIELLGYEEYLDALGSTITLSYDELNQRVFICDGLLGYVYSVRDKSLGEGPANITGVGYQDGSLIFTAYKDVTVQPFELCTDIYDMGNRKNKTIMSIEAGTDLVNALYAAIDYRNNKASAFATTPWAIVNPNGVTPLPCFGVEFRFRLKLLTYEQFELDYLRINGIVHNYSYLDSFSRSA